MKKNLLERLCIFLFKEGFIVKHLNRNCFDIIARKNCIILLIKILEDANSINKEYVKEMERISAYINGSPMIVAEKAGYKLEDNIIYTRFGMTTINFNTFVNCIHRRYPFIKKTRAGLTALLLSKKLRQIREEKGMSIAELSKKIGVSRRMVQQYEKIDSLITINNAIKIYELFGHQVFGKINIFNFYKEREHDESSDITKKFSQLGFETIEMKKAPFDIIAKMEKDIILTEVGDKADPNFISLSKLLDANNLVIFKRKKPKDVPALTKQEFLEFEKACDLLNFLKEFEY